jgi:hypothetical protein
MLALALMGCSFERGKGAPAGVVPVDDLAVTEEEEKDGTLGVEGPLEERDDCCEGETF